jgi:hypothetical protein
LIAKTIPALPSLDLITFLDHPFYKRFLMLSLALEKQNVLFLQKDDVAKVGGMFLKINFDGGSIRALMGSTSENMYLCQVPSFGFEMIKLRPGG